MKKILATAYAINPYKGSEDGMGWNMTLEIARHQKVIAITRENNQAAIEKYQQENPNPLYERITFAYFDLPYWMRFWKKGGRGAMLYYYMWQFGIVNFIRRNKFEFDIVHNLNFHNDWTPSFLWRLDKPMVWGPVGHHPSIPKEYLKVYGQKAMMKDRLTWMAKKWFWKFDPFLKLTKLKAKKIMAMNSTVADVLNVDKNKIVALPSVASESVDASVLPPDRFAKRETGEFKILSVGRFVALKGFDITISAFATFYHSLPAGSKAKLILVGKGPEEKRLKELIKKYKIEDAVEMIHWVERSALKKMYESASVFFFPSHEGAGMVVPEAMSYGIPVLCFDNCGPGEMVDETCGLKVPYSNYEQSILAFAKQLDVLYNDPTLREKFAKGAIQKHRTQFLWENKAKVFQQAYQGL